MAVELCLKTGSINNIEIGCVLPVKKFVFYVVDPFYGEMSIAWSYANDEVEAYFKILVDEKSIFIQLNNPTATLAVTPFAVHLPIQTSSLASAVIAFDCKYN